MKRFGIYITILIVVLIINGCSGNGSSSAWSQLGDSLYYKQVSTSSVYVKYKGFIHSLVIGDKRKQNLPFKYQFTDNGDLKLIVDETEYYIAKDFKSCAI